MIRFDRIIGFDWDSGNARKSSDKHAVSMLEAEQVFFRQPLVVAADDKHSLAEPRYRALGITDQGRCLTVIFTLRSDATLIRIISARDMHRKERTLYEEAP